jgi:hypothetical protein
MPLQSFLQGGSGQVSSFEQSIFLFPSTKLLVVLPTGRSELALYRFDWEDGFAKAGVDYLIVTNRPKTVVPPGTAWSYTPAVKSKKGGAKLRLEAGPDGMKLADGRLTWTPTAAFTIPASVVLSVTDTSGQEIIHNFTLSPSDK